MKKKIRKVTVYHVDHFTGDDIPDDWPQVIQSETEYDGEGRIVREAQFSADGVTAEQYVMKYDEKGLPVEMTILDEDGQALEIRRNEYGQEGRLVKTSIQYMDGSLGTTEYIYDEWGNLALKRTLDEDGNLEARESFLTVDGKIILAERYGENEAILFRQEDVYDQGMHKESRIWSAEEGEPYTRIIHFNEAGRKNEELKYDSRDKLVERISIEEDKDGRLLKITDENVSRKLITEFSYDHNGNLSGQLELSPDGAIIHQVERTYNDNLDPERINVIFANPYAGQHDYCLIYRYEYY